MLRRRVTLLVAAAGYGKTTLLRDQLRGVPARWHSGSEAAAMVRAGEIDWDGQWLVLDDPAVLLTAEYGVDDPLLADQVHAATIGWPALVHFAGETLHAGARPDDVAQAIARGPAGEYLAEEVVRDPGELLPRLAVLGPVHPGLCASEDELRTLARTGLLDPPVAGHDSYRLVPVVAAVIRQRHPLDPPTRRRTLRTAAEWYAEAGEPAAAARAQLEAGEAARAADLLREHGARVLAADGADRLIALVEDLPESERTERLRLLHAEALALRGEVEAARAVCAPLDHEGELDPDVARVLGLLEYRSGRPRTALKLFARGRVDEERTAAESLLLSWTAAAHWTVGDQPACHAFAERAHRAALAARDDRALAAALVTLGFAAEMAGDPATEQQHYERALAVAESANDAVQAARIRTNLSSRLIGEGRNAEAAREAERAVRLAESVGYLSVLGLALFNQGEALMRLGRFTEAEDTMRRAVAVENRNGSRRLSYPLAGLGDIHRRRGAPSLARAAYEEAIRVAGDHGDRQGVVPPMVGLARLLADVEPETALSLAEEAAKHTPGGPPMSDVLLAQGWAVRGADNLAEAERTAAEVAAQARLHRDRPCLAEALELLAATTPDLATSRRSLTEALTIWRETDARLDVARMQYLLGSRSDATAAERMAARQAREVLAAEDVAPPQLGALGQAAAAIDPVTVRTLGRFEVAVGGEPLPPSAWQSRKARDLLRILLARRGRGIAREELCGLLWPDDDQAKLGHRLSVALSTVRAVLDPNRRAPGDYYVIADQSSVALDTSRVVVDVDTFLAEAQHGLRLHERGLASARPALIAAENLYTGDFFEDEPYDDWATPVREEARATYLRVVRTLAELCRRQGDLDATVQYLHRILAKDPYDEQCHLDLIDTLSTAGSHGEAARARTRYADAMRQVTSR